MAVLFVDLLFLVALLEGTTAAAQRRPGGFGLAW